MSTIRSTLLHRVWSSVYTRLTVPERHDGHNAEYICFASPPRHGEDRGTKVAVFYHKAIPPPLVCAA